jgi:hypothetical protein
MEDKEMSWKKDLFIIGLLILLAMLAVACGPKPTPTEAPTEIIASPTVVPTEIPSVVAVPFQSIWEASGHADATAAAFTHWNEESPAVIPADCTKCHTSTGLAEFVTNGKSLDVNVPGGVVTCTTCHNEAVSALTSVTFPSGNVVNNLGPEARCISCHQGRESKAGVDAFIEVALGPEPDPDVTSPDLSFRNVHYFTAGATMYASQAAGGYEYAGQVYDRKFTHVENMDTCLSCHDSHSLDVKVLKCAECHENASSVDDMKNTRMMGSMMDYDGDGDRAEGIYFEIQGLQEKLLTAIQAYAFEISAVAIVYDPATYPYFFIDNNEDGILSEEEAVATNAYNAWTPRLIKATYNYHFTFKDPGAYAHNAKYAIELLYDSISDLNNVLTNPVDLSAAHRIDAGHFAGSAPAFRHWDSGVEVEAACARCHSATGLTQYLKYSTNIGVPISNGFMCSTCHDMLNFPSLPSITSVTFPSGKSVSMGGKDIDGKFVGNDSNVCLMCHQGRESTVSLNAKIGDTEPNTINPKLTFSNVHYFAAGGSLFGNDVQTAYQFSGKTYLGQNTLHPLNKCVECHDTHNGEIKTDTCAACHPNYLTPADIRYGTNVTDWDGDGATTESMKNEISSLQDTLYARILAYASSNGSAIVYGPGYPYWVKDLNGNGIQDANEAVPANSYTSYTPNLLAATYNYHFLQKEPGNYAHNPLYAIQILYDSIEALGGDVTTYTRP